MIPTGRSGLFGQVIDVMRNNKFSKLKYILPFQPNRTSLLCTVLRVTPPDLCPSGGVWQEFRVLLEEKRGVHRLGPIWQVSLLATTFVKVQSDLVLKVSSVGFILSSVFLDLIVHTPRPTWVPLECRRRAFMWGISPVYFTVSLCPGPRGLWRVGDDFLVFRDSSVWLPWFRSLMSVVSSVPLEVTKVVVLRRYGGWNPPLKEDFITSRKILI